MHEHASARREPAGDPSDVAARLTGFAPVARRILTSYTSHPSDAEDLVQSVLLELLRDVRLGAFDPDRGPFEAWAVRRTHSRAIDWRRRRALESRLFAEPADLERFADGAQRSRDASGGISEWIRALDPLERRLVRLRYEECASICDVARATGLSHARVSRLLARVRSKLRRAGARERIGRE